MCVFAKSCIIFYNFFLKCIIDYILLEFYARPFRKHKFLSCGILKLILIKSFNCKNMLLMFDKVKYVGFLYIFAFTTEDC